VLIARLFGFQGFDLLEFAEARQDPDIAKLFA
jgi:hypothetical protein